MTIDSNGTHTAGPSSMPCPDPSLHYAPVEDSAPLARVTLDVCQACLKGDGGECHTPGCAFWMSRAPDVPLGIVPNQTADCPWCGEPLEVSEGTDGVCPNGHEWWEEIDAD